MARRKGFTLVELVVVVMILGILAAVAVPKLINTTGNATDNGLRQTVGVVRDAIELYAANNAGAFPGADGVEATFKADIKPYLRRDLPKCPVGAKNAEVKITTTDITITGEASPTKGWHYCNKNGQFIANTTKVSNDGATTYDQF